MGSQFWIPVLWNFCSESMGGIKRWDPAEGSNTDGPSSVTVRIEWLFALQLLCCEICVENQWGGGRKHCFINFCSLVVLCLLAGEVWWDGRAKIASFSSRDFSRSNKHDTFWHSVLTGYFYGLSLWGINASEFRSLEIYKKSGLPLSPITYSINNHADNHLYLNIFICFKCYIQYEITF